jgi:8-oxo-dGTP pyrophosphatase MutT (NUDIX family)
MTGTGHDWHAAVLAARAHDAGARVPVRVRGVEVGSVARTELAPLAGIAGLALRAGALALPDEEDAWHALNLALAAAGRLRGWRDEWYEVRAADGTPMGLRVERASARYWGLLTVAAHCNGHVGDRLWIARRSLTKATDPGLLDNMVAGGVPAGQSPWQALLREGGEEAGLSPAQMASAVPGSVLRLERDVPEGVQREWLHVYDLELPAGVEPVNRDGEVAGFDCLPLPQALERIGEMTVDAALATLDFAWRRGFIDPATKTASAWEAVVGGQATRD